MTIIAGLVEGDKVYLGADRAYTCAEGRVDICGTKLRYFPKADMHVGLTGDFAQSTALCETIMSLGPRSKLSHLEAALAETTFNGQRPCLSAAVAIFRGQLISIEEDGEVCVPVRGYAAAGSGEDFAMGAFWATVGQKKNPLGRLKRVLSCACDMHGSCRPPFDIILVTRCQL